MKFRIFRTAGNDSVSVLLEQIPLALCLTQAEMVKKIFGGLEHVCAVGEELLQENLPLCLLNKKHSTNVSIYLTLIVAWTGERRYGNILSNHRQDGNVEAHRLRVRRKKRNVGEKIRAKYFQLHIVCSLPKFPLPNACE